MLNPGVIAVIRADSSGQLLDAARAMADGGLTAMEVTMTTPNALEVIRSVVKELGDRVLMGVGTVLDDVTARLAILAGAEYVVTPVLRPDVIALCRRYSKPVVSGAYTPTEALTAHEAGADFIKLFPADTLGPKYIKALKGPLPQLEIIPTGGVDAKNASAVRSAPRRRSCTRPARANVVAETPPRYSDPSSVMPRTRSASSPVGRHEAPSGPPSTR
jgi:2-dehydro-3-deoxyphosphogluconate aldolase/(4S)-4-hydroxy-2-oxoglutarate aldolase